MAIPLATTTVAVLRVPADAARDPYDPEPAAAVVVAGVRAHISNGSGAERVAGGAEQTDVTFPFGCDPVDLLNGDQVRDETTLDVYDVVWVRRRVGLGLDHMAGELRQVTGVAK